MKTLTDKNIVVENGQRVYRWHRNYKQVQLNFFTEKVGMRREKTINDFLYFNSTGPVYIIKDNETFTDVTFPVTEYIELADTLLITDQRFSRLPCPEIVAQLTNYLNCDKDILVCLNRTYINIDNSYHDAALADSYPTAIHEWLTQNINGNVVNLSHNYFEDGTYFTWVIPDQIFWITA